MTNKTKQLLFFMHSPRFGMVLALPSPEKFSVFSLFFFLVDVFAPKPSDNAPQSNFAKNAAKAAETKVVIFTPKPSDNAPQSCLVKNAVVAADNKVVIFSPRPCDYAPQSHFARNAVVAAEIKVDNPRSSSIPHGINISLASSRSALFPAPVISRPPSPIPYARRVTKSALPVEDYGLPVEDCELPVEDYELPVKDYELPVKDCELPVEDCELPVTTREPPVKTSGSPVKKNGHLTVTFIKTIKGNKTKGGAYGSPFGLYPARGRSI